MKGLRVLLKWTGSAQILHSGMLHQLISQLFVYIQLMLTATESVAFSGVEHSAAHIGTLPLGRAERRMTGRGQGMAI